jgi:aspartate aminotransferase
MLNSPCNPTGTVYTRRELQAIAGAILNSNAAILSDEIYERLTFGEARSTCIASLAPELRERTITVSGASKTYAMTGWRMGWAIGPGDVIRAMANVQSQQTSSPSSISQYATMAALAGDQSCVETMRKEFAARRDLVCERMRAWPGISFRVPDGAFYVFLNISSLLGRTIAGRSLTDSAAFCQLALEIARVNLVPGSAFGAEAYVRLSFAAGREQLQGGLDQLESLLRSV